MNEKDIQRLLDLVESKFRTGVTAKEALETFIGADIMDADGNYTAPYLELLEGIDVE